jgi:hypothetical protein
MKERKIKLNGATFWLGRKYQETKLGNVGVAVSGASYLTGCDQILLMWNDTTGRPVEHWAHVTDIAEVKAKPVNGGPAPTIPTQHP